MKYILVGTLDSGWTGHHKERVKACKAKAGEFGITFDAVYYTHGVYDFVDVIEASDAYVVLAFSMWYSKIGYGHINAMPAFGEEVLDRIDKIS